MFLPTPAVALVATGSLPAAQTDPSTRAASPSTRPTCSRLHSPDSTVYGETPIVQFCSS
jgi:hypothetical protein